MIHSSDASPRYVFGPVFSRRLGCSLGVDLVPLKTCSYDCVYCQLGRTSQKTVRRAEYVPVADVIAQLEDKLKAVPAPDYITLSGSGEPTLHVGLADAIAAIKRLTHIPVAVLTNGSLLWDAAVRAALAAADLVLPSLDAATPAAFERVNRPHHELEFALIVEGLALFCRDFGHKVRLEVFLLDGITAESPEVERLAALVRQIAPARVQLNTVSRPPAEPFAVAVGRGKLRRLAGLFGDRAEIIAESQAKGPAPRRLPGENDILGLVSRRPCTPEDIARSLGLHYAETLKSVEHLAEAGILIAERLGGRTFYRATREAECP